jgi:hypothetical protein
MENRIETNFVTDYQPGSDALVELNFMGVGPQQVSDIVTKCPDSTP